MTRLWPELRSDLNALTFDQSRISGLSIMNSFCQENVPLKTASVGEFTELAAYDKTAYFYLTN